MERLKVIFFIFYTALPNKEWAFFVAIMVAPPDDNLKVYEQPKVVRSYVPNTKLAKAEEVLLTTHSEDYAGKSVLDIGVGAGRTTAALAASASEYIGIDYSHAMVAACKERFGALKNARFVQEDARTLSAFGEHSIDTAFFSFNGIDTVDMEGRKAVFCAVHRVLKRGGIFIFSFHNAAYIDSVYSLRMPKNPFKWMGAVRLWQGIRKINGPIAQYRDKDYFFIKDGAEDFQLDICYLRPSFQLGMLLEAGFELTDCLAAHSGKPLDPAAADEFRGPWIYLRCRAI